MEFKTIEARAPGLSEAYKSHHLSLWLEVILGSMATFQLNAQIKRNTGKNTLQRSSTGNQ